MALAWTSVKFEAGASIMRREFTEQEWTAVKPMLPNKPRGAFGG